MFIEQMELRNFRNYHDLKIEFDKNYNIIYGDNAQGKTNILEAIFLCASGRSHRTSKDTDLIKIDEEQYNVKIKVKKEKEEKLIEVAYKNGDKKRIQINEIPQKKIGNLIGNLNAVIFSPEDLSVIKEGPSERRRFIDITISQLRPSYFYDLQTYTKILQQRNTLLREMQQKKYLIDTLDIWDEKLADVGAKIIRVRSEFINKMDAIIRKKHSGLTKGNEEIEMRYCPNVEIGTTVREVEIKEAIKREIGTKRKREIERAVTLCGPHKDDYEVYLNEKSLKMYGSQGQQRTAILSVKLSEVELIMNENGEYPVLLLDDVMSELDEKRQKQLMEIMEQIQTFVTCTERNDFEKKNNATLYKVSNGRITLDKI